MRQTSQKRRQRFGVIDSCQRGKKKGRKAKAVKATSSFLCFFPENGASRGFVAMEERELNNPSLPPSLTRDILPKRWVLCFQMLLLILEQKGLLLANDRFTSYFARAASRVKRKDGGAKRGKKFFFAFSPGKCKYRRRLFKKARVHFRGNPSSVSSE